MPQRWHQSRTNQAALIGAVTALLIALVTTLGRRQDHYPVIEVKDLTPAGEQVLARLALSPTRQIVDSSAFADLADKSLLWNDSLGAAMRRPDSFEWGITQSDTLEEVSIGDVSIFRWFNGLARQGFGEGMMPKSLRFFGVRLDKPSLLTITRDTKLDSTIVGNNPFRDPKYFLAFMRMSYGSALDKMSIDSLALAQREAVVMLDSVTKSYLPSTRKIYSGVFVARVSEGDLTDAFTAGLLKRPLLDRVATAIGVSTGAPTLMVLDRDRHTLLFSDVVRVDDALLEGRITPSVTLNRAGYAIERDKVVYVVMLQFVSDQPKPVLEELQRLLGSVRLRASN